MHTHTTTPRASRSRTILSGLVLTFAWAVSAAAAPSHHGHPGKLSDKVRDEAKAKGSAKVDVLVRFTGNPGASERSLVKALGGHVRRQHQSRWVAVRIPGNALEALANSPAVEFIATDAPMSVAAADASRETADLPSPAMPESILNGAGVTIAIVDSGVAVHPEIQTLVAAVDFVGTASAVVPANPIVGTAADSIDLYGHGTHVAGLMVGNGSHSLDGRYVGVAPQASLVSVRVLNDVGSGQATDVLAGLEWVLAHKAEYGIRVVNLSLGHPIFEAAAVDPLVQAVDALWDAGVVVVCAAGNNGIYGHGTVNSPCNSRKVITVGAMNDHGTPDLADDTITTYTSRGPTRFDLVAKPDLIAPGNKIVSARATASYLDVTFPDRRVAADASQPDVQEHFVMSGTSMATPIVSGTAALMLQQEPTLNPGTVKARLMLSAKKVNVGDPFATGAGLLDIVAAIHATGQVVDALSPLVALNASTGILSVENTAVLWGDASFSLQALWSTAVLWSPGTLWDQAVVSTTAVLWGDGTLWGDSTLWGNGILWGDSSLWSDSSLWGDSILWGDSSLWGDTTLWSATTLWSDSSLWGDTTLWADGTTLVEDP